MLYLFGSQLSAGVDILAGKKVTANDPLADLDVGIVPNCLLPEPLSRIKFYANLYNDLTEIIRPLSLDLVLLEENHSVFQVEAIKGICIY